MGSGPAGPTPRKGRCQLAASADSVTWWTRVVTVRRNPFEASKVCSVIADLSDDGDRAVLRIEAEEASLHDALDAALTAGRRPFTVASPTASGDGRSQVSSAVLERLLADAPGATVLPDPGHRVSTVTVDASLGPSWAVVDPSDDWYGICFWPASDRLQFITIDDAGIHPAPVSRWAAIDYRYPDGGIRSHRSGLLEASLWFELHRYTDSLTVRISRIGDRSRTGTATRMMDDFLREVADHDSARILMGLSALGVPVDGSLAPEDLVGLADLDETFESMVALAITPPADIIPELIERAAHQLGGGLGAAIRSAQLQASARPFDPSVNPSADAPPR